MLVLLLGLVLVRVRYVTEVSKLSTAHFRLELRYIEVDALYRLFAKISGD